MELEGSLHIVAAHLMMPSAQTFKGCVTFDLDGDQKRTTVKEGLGDIVWDELLAFPTKVQYGLGAVLHLDHPVRVELWDHTDRALGGGECTLAKFFPGKAQVVSIPLEEGPHIDLEVVLYVGNFSRAMSPNRSNMAGYASFSRCWSSPFQPGSPARPLTQIASREPSSPVPQVPPRAKSDDANALYSILKGNALTGRDSRPMEGAVEHEALDAEAEEEAPKAPIAAPALSTPPKLPLLKGNINSSPARAKRIEFDYHGTPTQIPSGSSFEDRAEPAQPDTAILRVDLTPPATVNGLPAVDSPEICKQINYSFESDPAQLESVDALEEPPADTVAAQEPPAVPPSLQHVTKPAAADKGSSPSKKQISFGNEPGDLESFGSSSKLSTKKLSFREDTTDLESVGSALRILSKNPSSADSPTRPSSSSIRKKATFGETEEGAKTDAPRKPSRQINFGAKQDDGEEAAVHVEEAPPVHREDDHEDEREGGLHTVKSVTVMGNARGGLVKRRVTCFFTGVPEDDDDDYDDEDEEEEEAHEVKDDSQLPSAPFRPKPARPTSKDSASAAPSTPEPPPAAAADPVIPRRALKTATAAASHAQVPAELPPLNSSVSSDFPSPPSVVSPTSGASAETLEHERHTVKALLAILPTLTQAQVQALGLHILHRDDPTAPASDTSEAVWARHFFHTLVQECSTPQLLPLWTSLIKVLLSGIGPAFMASPSQGTSAPLAQLGRRIAHHRESLLHATRLERARAQELQDLLSTSLPLTTGEGRSGLTLLDQERRRGDHLAARVAAFESQIPLELAAVKAELRDRMAAAPGEASEAARLEGQVAEVELLLSHLTGEVACVQLLAQQVQANTPVPSAPSAPPSPAAPVPWHEPPSALQLALDAERAMVQQLQTRLHSLENSRASPPLAVQQDLQSLRVLLDREVQTSLQLRRQMDEVVQDSAQRETRLLAYIQDLERGMHVRRTPRTRPEDPPLPGPRSPFRDPPALPVYSPYRSRTAVAPMPSPSVADSPVVPHRCRLSSCSLCRHMTPSPQHRSTPSPRAPK